MGASSPWGQRRQVIFYFSRILRGGSGGAQASLIEKIAKTAKKTGQRKMHENVRNCAPSQQAKAKMPEECKTHWKNRKCLRNLHKIYTMFAKFTQYPNARICATLARASMLGPRGKWSFYFGASHSSRQNKKISCVSVSTVASCPLVHALLTIKYNPARGGTQGLLRNYDWNFQRLFLCRTVN